MHLIPVSASYKDCCTLSTGDAIQPIRMDPEPLMCPKQRNFRYRTSVRRHTPQTHHCSVFLTAQLRSANVTKKSPKVMLVQII